MQKETMMMMRDGLYHCPDCERDAKECWLPLSSFSIVSGRGREAYCKPHSTARSSARLRARLDPASPQYDAALHARQKASKRASIARARAAAEKVTT